MTDAYEMIMDVRLLCLQKQIWINAEGKKYFLSLENSFLSCSDKLQVARSSKFFWSRTILIHIQNTMLCFFSSGSNSVFHTSYNNEQHIQ